ncbi:MAG: aminotransferase class V-fold PLP-dependent enzyme [Deltaproteobacteria bacterium]
MATKITPLRTAPRSKAVAKRSGLTRFRGRFPILRRYDYLINNSLGAMPKETYGALREYADAWVTRGVLAWDEWLPMVTKTGDLVGRLMGAPAGSVVMHQNVSTLVSIVLSCLDYGARPKLVSTELNFPSILYNLHEQERRGANVEIVASRDGLLVDEERVIQAIDEKTALVCLDLVLFRSSGIVDVRPIVEAAHRRGALVLLDVYQAIGAVPFDVRALGVDIVVGGSVKWLCGGPGACYLHVAPHALERLRPSMTGWFSHARPFGFELGPVEPADDIHRFMGGSPAVPALYAARSGYETVAEAGVGQIRARSLELTQRIIDGADAQGLTVNTPRPRDRRGGTVCVDFEGADIAHDLLIERGILIDYRPRCGIRLSPHFYNTEAECDLALDAIRDIRSSASFRRKQRARRPAVARR